MKRGRVGVEVEIGGLAVDETAAASAEVLGSRPCVEATFVRSLPSPWGDFRLEVLDTAGERLAGFGDRLRLESVIAFSRIGFPPPTSPPATARCTGPSCPSRSRDHMCSHRPDQSLQG